MALVDPFLSRAERGELLRERWGVGCACESCELEGEAGVESDRRRRRVREIWEELPKVGEKGKAVWMVEEALKLLVAEEIGGWRGTFCYDGESLSQGRRGMIADAGLRLKRSSTALQAPCVFFLPFQASV